MAQFDVYKNPNNRTRKLFPYIVDIQSPIISELSTRIVVPLGKMEFFAGEKLSRLTPELEYEGYKMLFLMPQVSSIPADVLKAPIGSIAHLRDEIIGALDFAITGI